VADLQKMPTALISGIRKLSLELRTFYHSSFRLDPTEQAARIPSCRRW
jgi:hypothetical protein